MQSKPEIDKASTAPTVKALNEKSQIAKKGTIVNNSTVVPADNQPVFNFGDNQVRVVVLNGDPWFVAADVWAALKLTNPSKAMKVLASRERSNFKLGRQGEVNIVSEAGLYTLVLRCRDAVKPGTVAYQFRTWVTGEVLPAIRKTGQYKQPVAQANLAVDYDRISPAQKQDLREIVQAIVDAGIQKYGETWARFQSKFRINSYEALPAERYEEARQYLISKLPNGYAGVIHEETVPLERLEPALQAANAVATKIQYAALMSMMKSEDLRRGRWMVSFGYGVNPEPNVKQIEYNACVAPIDKFHLVIEDSVAVDPHTLMQLATTCMNKLASMAAHSTKALSA